MCVCVCVCVHVFSTAPETAGCEWRMLVWYKRAEMMNDDDDDDCIAVVMNKDSFRATKHDVAARVCITKPPEKVVRYHRVAAASPSFASVAGGVRRSEPP